MGKNNKSSNKKSSAKNNVFLKIDDKIVNNLIVMFLRYDSVFFVRKMKMVIHPHMFETENDYQYFMAKVSEFAKIASNIGTLSLKKRSDEKKKSDAVKSFPSYESIINEVNINQKIQEYFSNCESIISDLEKNFPNQLQSLILANLIFCSNLFAAIKDSLKYFEKIKNMNRNPVCIEILNQNEYGYKFIQIVSISEMDTAFLLQPDHERKSINKGLRNLTNKENEFLKMNAMFFGIRFLSPSDFAYVAKKDEYASALYFNMKSFIDFMENEERLSSYSHQELEEQNRQSILFLVGRNIQYIDLNKLKALVLYRATLVLNEATKTKYSNMIVDAKALIQDLIREIDQLKNNTMIKFGGFSFEIFDPNSINFKNASSKIEGEENERVYSCLDEKIKIKRIKVEEKKKIDLSTGNMIELSTGDIIELAEFVLAKVKVKEILYEYDNGNLVTFDLDLNQNINVDAIIEVIYDMINEQNPGASPDEIYKLCFAYSKVFIIYLYRNELAEVRDMIKFDEDSVCELIIEGVIEMPTLDLKENEFSKDSIKYLCVRQPERIMECINNKYITKQELLGDSPIEVYFTINPIVLQELYQNGLLTINEIFEFVALERVSLDSIKQINFDEERLKSDLNPETLAELYIEIVRKRTEYEDVSRKNNEEQLAQGVKEADIKPSEEELRLQKELQVLNSKKCIYIYLLKYLEKNGIDNNEFYENVFLEAFERNDDTYGEFLEVVEEMYKDEVVSIDLLKSNDIRLATKLMQKGVIRPRDRKKFKDLIIGGEEGKIDLKPEEVEKDKYILEKMKGWTSQELVIYSKLKAVIEEIINNNSITNAEKMGRIYNILDGINKVEDLLRRIYENKLLKDGIDGIGIRSISSNNSSPTQPKSSQMKGSANNNSNNYLYPAHIIWKFMEILDPDVYREGYVDGHVVFRLPKLDSVIIESMWKKEKDGRLSRSYGSATIAMGLGVFDINKNYITIPCNKGLKIDRNRAKGLLPTIQTSKGQKRAGVIRHEKDLSKSGKKDWFDSLLNYFRISLGDIRAGRDGRYTSEDADKIEEFLKSIREVGKDLYERL